jgi:hypothetical protein
LAFSQPETGRQALKPETWNPAFSQPETGRQALKPETWN